MSYDPAPKLISTLLDSINAAEAEMFDDRQKKRADKNVDPADTIFVLESAVQVYRWGLVYALMALQRVAPDHLDAFAEDLQLAWDAGDSIPEWAWQWADELKRGVRPTLPFLAPEP